MGSILAYFLPHKQCEEMLQSLGKQLMKKTREANRLRGREDYAKQLVQQQQHTKEDILQMTIDMANTRNLEQIKRIQNLRRLLRTLLNKYGLRIPLNEDYSRVTPSSDDDDFAYGGDHDV